MALRAAYTPRAIGLLTASAGFGVETAHRDPLLLGSFIMHAPGTFWFYGGVQAMLLRASYQVLRQQYRNNQVVQMDTMESGHAWRRSVNLVIGIQKQFSSH